MRLNFVADVVSTEKMHKKKYSTDKSVAVQKIFRYFDHRRLYI